MIIFDVLSQQINNQNRIGEKTLNIIRLIDPMVESVKAFNDFRKKKKPRELIVINFEQK